MFKRMKLGAKIGTGFGFLIVISLIVGAVSVFNMHYVRDGVDKLSREYTPEAILASELERRVYRTMYNIRGYGFTGDKKFYEEGMTAMAQVKETIAKLEDLASRSVHSVRLKESLEEIKKKLSEYEGLVERTKKLITQQQEAATRMRSTAGVYMENVYRVLNDQNSSMEREINEGASQEALKERLKKITLVNNLIDQGNFARIANLMSRANRDSKIMEEGIKKVFPEIEKNYNELRLLLRVEADKEALEKVWQSARTYKEKM